MVSYLYTKSLLGIVKKVLILVVMEDGLVHDFAFGEPKDMSSLNPCCNGRWSRTCEINKLNPNWETS